MKNLYESLFSTASAPDKDALYGQLLQEAIYDFFHIEHNPDKSPMTVTKSGSYYDVMLDLSNNGEITIDIGKSKSTGIDFKHTRVKLKTKDRHAWGIKVVLKSNGAEINTNNFFTYLETDDEIEIDECSLGKDIEIKTTENAINIFTRGKRGLYIKAKITCHELNINTQFDEVVDMTGMKKSAINRFYVVINLKTKQGCSLVSRILKVDDKFSSEIRIQSFISNLLSAQFDDNRPIDRTPQLNPGAVALLKLPDISCISKMRSDTSFGYGILFTFGYESYALHICKKGTGGPGGWCNKIEQEDPTINAKWDVYEEQMY